MTKGLIVFSSDKPKTYRVTKDGVVTPDGLVYPVAHFPDPERMKQCLNIVLPMIANDPRHP